MQPSGSRNAPCRDNLVPPLQRCGTTALPSAVDLRSKCRSKRWATQPRCNRGAPCPDQHQVPPHDPIHIDLSTKPPLQTPLLRLPHVEPVGYLMPATPV